MAQIPFNADTLIQAYSQGFFPMPDPDSAEILWFHPEPRAIIPLDGFHCSRSLRRTLRRVPFEIRFNKDFAATMHACSERPDTWISDEFKEIYQELHERGYAHSIEVWLAGKLVGGLYGVSLGGAFFAESKFHLVSDASKVALYHLVEHMKRQEMLLLEVQFVTDHLRRLGAVGIPRDEYVQRLECAVASDHTFLENGPRAVVL